MSSPPNSTPKTTVKYILDDNEADWNKHVFGVTCLQLITHNQLISGSKDGTLHHWILQQDNSGGGADATQIVHRNSYRHHTDWVNDLIWLPAHQKCMWCIL
jgi:WD40 repeat protein